MVGFWSPPDAKTLSVPGYDLHVLTADRTAGGHVLDCRGQHLRLQLQRDLDLRVSLPHTAEFLKADLTHDPGADLDKAEH
jgi:acetolactate decarboxylase